MAAGSFDHQSAQEHVERSAFQLPNDHITLTPTYLHYSSRETNHRSATHRPFSRIPFSLLLASHLQSSISGDDRSGYRSSPASVSGYPPAIEEVDLVIDPKYIELATVAAKTV
ncbi:hypothetical protein L1887_27840 [Cichorium endivia]|nr:hypothetical protein L1887_27840 [Cichorium endivia]